MAGTKTTGSTRHRRWIGVTAVTLVVIAASYTAVFARQLRCALVEHSDLRRMHARLYVDPRMPSSQAAAIDTMITKAHRRASELLGTSIAEPTVIAGPDQQVIDRFGQEGNPTAVTHLYLGDAYMVLGPDGLDVDVVSHELMHAELAARIGWLRRELEIPAWFDEGLAMQVDHRDDYSEEAWRQVTDGGRRAPRLGELAGSSAFGSENYLAAFTTSKHEVHRWLQKVGTAGLRDLLDRVQRGEAFQESYRAIESAAR